MKRETANKGRFTTGPPERETNVIKHERRLVFRVGFPFAPRPTRYTRSVQIINDPVWLCGIFETRTRVFVPVSFVRDKITLKTTPSSVPGYGDV